jgi:hypothetical protein
MDPRFLDMGTSWMWAVSLTPLPLYPRYPLDRRLGGPQSLSGWYGEIKILDPTGTRTTTPSVVEPVVSRYTDYATLAHNDDDDDDDNDNDNDNDNVS